jgi:anti-sigma regulatory factor (Ser/Thr protein kinase)
MGHATPWSYNVTLAPLASNVGVARALVRECLLEHDLACLVEDVRLVASEFATNAVVHARTPFTVSLEGSADSVRLSISDNSKLKLFIGVRSLLSAGGRGLPIVDSCASDWGVTNGKQNAKSVWALFDIDT